MLRGLSRQRANLFRNRRVILGVRTKGTAYFTRASALYEVIKVRV
jgi:hypothetical protein